MRGRKLFYLIPLCKEQCVDCMPENRLSVLGSQTQSSRTRSPPKHTRCELSREELAAGSLRATSGHRGSTTAPLTRLNRRPQRRTLPVQEQPRIPSSGKKKSCCSLNMLGIEFSRYQTEKGIHCGQRINL